MGADRRKLHSQRNGDRTNALCAAGRPHHRYHLSIWMTSSSPRQRPLRAERRWPPTRSLTADSMAGRRSAPQHSPTQRRRLLDPNGDTHSLLATNRTASYMGPSLNLLSVNNVVAGATYQVSAYVLLAAPDSTNPTATISTKTADCATSGRLRQLSRPPARFRAPPGRRCRARSASAICPGRPRA